MKPLNELDLTILLSMASMEEDGITLEQLYGGMKLG
jgi:hypothetical protein